MTLEQKFAKCLYIAYKKNIEIKINYFYLDGNPDIFVRDYKNTIWSEWSEEDCLSCIEEDPSAGYNFNFKGIDSFMGWTLIADGKYELCSKIWEDIPEFNKEDIDKFIKEFDIK